MTLSRSQKAAIAMKRQGKYDYARYTSRYHDVLQPYTFRASVPLSVQKRYLLPKKDFFVTAADKGSALQRARVAVPQGALMMRGVSPDEWRETPTRRILRLSSTGYSMK